MKLDIKDSDGISEGVPVLETQRLILRRHQLEDYAGCISMWADPVVTRFIGGKPSTQQQTWSRLLTYIGHWELMGFGYWAVQEKSSSQYIGEMGFANFNRELEPSIKGEPEIGWVLKSQFHGKGYATEGLQAVTKWGDAKFGSKRTVCLINPENLASIRVAAKIGYKELQRTTYNGEPTLLFSRVSPATTD